MRPTRSIAAIAALSVAATLTAVAAPADAGRGRVATARAQDPGPPKVATMVGRGGAVTSVDPYATRIGLRVLKQGGNATDAAIATAAALGVTEPFSSGIGGGGYFVHYSARTSKVSTIDGRETAPRSMPHDAFIDPKTGDPYNFTPELVTSGVSVGVPGSLATWKRALQRWGTRSLGRSLAPATRLARHGFKVDGTFHKQVVDNKVRFKAFTPTRKLYWRGGHAPRVGSTFHNRDLAATYDLLARRGTAPFYRGRIAREIVHNVRRPPRTEHTKLPIPKGYMSRRDLARYRALDQRPTHSRYRGYDVYGMAPSSSGGSTVGEALNILERYDVPDQPAIEALHLYLESSALAFADRGAYVGDRKYVDVPLHDLLSDKYAKERACEIDPAQAMPKPTEAGDVTSYDGRCDAAAGSSSSTPDTESVSTTNLTVADRWGDVVEYTLTIEQIGGSGIVVPGRGFLLNNELTDFSAEYQRSDPNRIQPGKRPRSSMSPTILLRHGRPFLALGSPGGSTIITTVLQMLFNRIDRGMSLPRAIAAPRATQRNTETDLAEPAFLRRYGAGLEALGHDVERYVDSAGSTEIGAATGIEFGPHKRLTAVAEPKRRGGGSAAVVHRR